MRVEITLRPVFWLSLFRTDVDLLMKLAGHHYDGACRQAAKPGNFLYGWFNVTRDQSPCGTYKIEDVPKCNGDRRELDTVLKICEGTRLALSAKVITPPEALRLDHICAMIMTALETSTIICDTTNQKLEPITEPSSRGSLMWATNVGRI